MISHNIIIAAMLVRDNLDTVPVSRYYSHKLVSQYLFCVENEDW